MEFLKKEYELNSADYEIRDDFSLVTDTKYNYILDFSYRVNNSVYELNTKMNYYNNSVNENFWNFDYDEYFKDIINEINKDNYFSIIHYKGKQFWIVENYFLTYETDTHYTYFNPNNKKKRETLKELISFLKNTLKDLEIKSFINNGLEIGAYSDRCYTEDYYNIGLFNNDLLTRLYNDDLYECSYDIVDYFDYNSVSFNDVHNVYNSDKLKAAAKKAYNKVLLWYKNNKLKKLHDKLNYVNYMLALD